MTANAPVPFEKIVEQDNVLDGTIYLYDIRPGAGVYVTVAGREKPFILAFDIEDLRYLVDVASEVLESVTASEPKPEANEGEEFSFYAEPHRIVPGVFTGVGSVSDDSDRVYLATDGDKLLTPAEALKVSIDLLHSVETAGGAA